MFKFTVTPDGGEPYEVTAESRDVLNWEKTTKGASLGKLKENPSFVDLYKIAHFAVKRLQMFSGTLVEFEQTCGLEVEREDDDEPDPTSADR